MNATLTRVLALPSMDLPERYQGLQMFKKVHNAAGLAALVIESDLDQDDDGKEEPGMTYGKFHQGQTSIDPKGEWCDPITIPYVVTPGHWPHDVEMGDLALVIYNDFEIFAIVGDVGPARKIGEASVRTHKGLGFDHVKNHHIQDVGIDRNVYTILFPGSKIATPCTFGQIQIAGQAYLGGLLAA